MAETPLPCTISTFQSSDGYQHHYRHFPAVGECRGQVVYLHGIQSHGGWYEYSASKLGEGGFDVFPLDRRGSGRNQSQRGDTPHFRRLLDDVAEFTLNLSSSPTPKYLVAVSWGGKVAVGLQRRHPGLFQGMALLYPGICPQIGLPFLTRLRIGLARLFRPTKLFDIPLSDPALFTDSLKWQTFIREDPLALHQVTARFLSESFRLDLYLALAPRFMTIPVLLMLAGKDRIIDNKKTSQYVNRFVTTEKNILEYPQGQHTLEFEVNRDIFIADLLAWLHQLSNLGRP